MTIFTSEKLAELCNCTVATINRKANEIGGRKMGRGWVFSEEKVSAWLNGAKTAKKVGRPRRAV